MFVDALVQVLAIVGIILYSIFRRPTIDELFDKNREYFNSLSSLKTDIVIDIEFDNVAELETQYKNHSSTTTILSHFPSDTALAEQSIIQIENESKYNFEKTIYKVNESGKKRTYYNEIYFKVDEGWIIDKSDEQINNVIGSTDFWLMESFSNSFKLEKGTVDIDGISCYKATAKIYRPSIIADYYMVKDMMGVFIDHFMDQYIDVSIYFNEETHILYKIEYDLTDLQHDVFLMNRKEELEDGHFYINIYFKEFNTSEEIKVPDEIKSVAYEYVGNEIEDPIDIPDENYELSGENAVILGNLAKEYSEKYTITQYIIETEENIENPELIKYKEYAYLRFENNKGGAFNVWVQNISDEPTHYLDCPVVKVDISAINCINFDEFGIGKNLNTKSTIEDFKSVLGRYTSVHDEGENINYKWRSYIDYCEIDITINKETNEVVSFYISSWDISYYLNKK